jgi:predicted nucleic acid-binding protein
MAYWDTSALVKLYVDESDSARYEQILKESVDELHTSIVTLAELYRALWAKSLDRGLSSIAPDALMEKITESAEIGRIRFVSYDPHLLVHFRKVIGNCYSRPEPVRLRSADGIHLASARSVAAVEIVCADKRMRAAASILGFGLLPPTL